MISVGPPPGADFSLAGGDAWYRYSPMGTLSWSSDTKKARMRAFRA